VSDASERSSSGSNPSQKHEDESTSLPATLDSSSSSSRAVDIASLRGLLQLLTIWCVNFYEDDFEKESDLKAAMGDFLQEVMQKCGDLIEEEFDPNSFSPFLSFELTPAPPLVQGSNENDDDKPLTLSPASKTDAPLRKPSVVVFARCSVAGGNATTSSRASLVMSRRLTSTPMAPPRKRGTVLMNSFVIQRLGESDEEEDEELDHKRPGAALAVGGSILQVQSGSYQRDDEEEGGRGRGGGIVKSRMSVSILGGTLGLQYNLVDFEPEVVSEQLTLIEHNLFCRIKRTELIDSKQVTYSNLKDLQAFSMHWMDFAISQVVSSSSIDEARKKIAILIDISTHMKKIRNYNGMFEILTILESTSVYRLKSAWAGLDPLRIEKHAALKALYASKDGFITFRTFLKTTGSQFPSLPYLGLYLKDIIYIMQLPTYTAPGIVNLIKMNSLAAKLVDIHSSQGTPYHFVEDAYVIQSLRSTPLYASEDSQYNASIALEPVAKKKTAP
jgi:hypothetical protein